MTDVLEVGTKAVTDGINGSHMVASMLEALIAIRHTADDVLIELRDANRRAAMTFRMGSTIDAETMRRGSITSSPVLEHRDTDDLTELDALAGGASFWAESNAHPAPSNIGYLSTPNQAYVRAAHPDRIKLLISELRSSRKALAAVTKAVATHRSTK